MDVFGVFLIIVLLVKLLLAERNPVHGLMRVTHNNAAMSKGMHSFNAQRVNRYKWYKYKRFQKIFGGEEVASIEEFPYMALMYFHVKERYQLKLGFCGATILNENYLLTAAHCVSDCSPEEDINKYKTFTFSNNCTIRDKKMYGIYVGSTVPERALAKAKVKTFHVHPEYKIYDFLNQCTSNHDLAIVELRRPLQFNSKISRVQLPLHKFASRAVKIQNCKIIGWGLKYLDEEINARNVLKRQLNVARTNVIDNQECLHHLNITNAPIIFLCRSTQICSTDPQNITGICRGDSGGPLICDGVQIGIVSWNSEGNICAGPNIVMGYSRVDIKMKWIRSIISK